ncbi:cdc42 effector protein 4a [Denticeps clupeoides]|uniref:cdc42 effector protein 4a n=1 Tax=Denticeps clupeoides TaxID=299321 RepID=UPI0010A56499|nr:cdc42 effector protein 4-like [Denticeps clupeoides]XP_028842920.1 cdc42 effector protein 4-like [Denticeps clupeoides]
MPILKQLGSGLSQTKRRSRVDLTPEMISAPLGDFRHTMHVGRSGDAFGDTSFLSSRSGEPPQDGETYPRSPRPGLLSRTFRSSKRSQSVTRVDQRENLLVPHGGSPTFVKNAMSLPFLNDESGGRDGGRVPKSLSSSPVKQVPDLDAKASNGAMADTQGLDLEHHEQRFGVLTDLRSPGYYNGGGLKKAESVMSFHVDLGPSMLDDVLVVMDKDDCDLGSEEEGDSEGRSSPLHMHNEFDEEVVEEHKDFVINRENEEEEPKGNPQQDQSEELQGHVLPDVDQQALGSSTPELQPIQLQNVESCSVSSSGSAALDEKPTSQPLEMERHLNYSPPPPVEDGDFSSFMDDEDDEIRV